MNWVLLRVGRGAGAAAPIYSSGKSMNIQCKYKTRTEPSSRPYV